MVTYAAEAIDANLADGGLRRGVGVREVIDGGSHPAVILYEYDTTVSV